jgi:ligand-binding sensor domain-containing protein
VPRGGYQGGCDEAGNWWVTQYGFIGSWNGSSWERRADTGTFGFETILACAPAREGGLWILADHEVRRYSRAGEVARRPIPGLASAVWSLMEDSRGHLWICTISQGVFQWLPDGTVARWTEGRGIGYNGTRFAFEDREGNLWIGTSGGGLTRLKQRRCVPFGAEQGLPERVVKSVAGASDGGVLLGTYGKGGFRLGRDGSHPRSSCPCPCPPGATCSRS